MKRPFSASTRLRAACGLRFHNLGLADGDIATSVSQGVPVQRLPLGHRVRPPRQPGGLGWVRESAFLQRRRARRGDDQRRAHVRSRFHFGFCWVSGERQHGEVDGGG